MLGSGWRQEGRRWRGTRAYLPPLPARGSDRRRRGRLEDVRRRRRLRQGPRSHGHARPASLIPALAAHAAAPQAAQAERAVAGRVRRGARHGHGRGARSAASSGLRSLAAGTSSSPSRTLRGQHVGLRSVEVETTSEAAITRCRSTGLGLDLSEPSSFWTSAAARATPLLAWRRRIRSARGLIGVDISPACVQAVARRLREPSLATGRERIDPARVELRVAGRRRTSSSRRSRSSSPIGRVARAHAAPEHLAFYNPFPAGPWSDWRCSPDTSSPPPARSDRRALRGPATPPPRRTEGREIEEMLADEPCRPGPPPRQRASVCNPHALAAVTSRFAAHPAHRSDRMPTATAGLRAHERAVVFLSRP